MSFLTPTSRWLALTTRNRLADQYFVYAVRTTKIYCRPSCAARLARRANITFYETPALAASAGYRACKRCKPDLDPPDDPQEVAVRTACNVIWGVPGKSIGLNELAERVGLTPSYLHKTFKARMGMTPKKYAESLRQQQQQDITVALTSGVGPEPAAGTYDDYTSSVDDLVVADFAFDSPNGLDSVTDNSGSMLGGFPDSSTYFNTPKTTDWSWLDTLTPEYENYELFNADALTQTMQSQEQMDWKDRQHPMSGQDWEILTCTQNVSDEFVTLT